MNIRTTLIRSSLAIALIAVCATAATLHSVSSRCAIAAPAAEITAQLHEKLDVTLLPTVHVTAQAPPLSVTLLPTVHVRAHVERMANATPATIHHESLATNTPVDSRVCAR